MPKTGLEAPARVAAAWWNRGVSEPVDPRARHAELVQEIEAHRAAYYGRDAPTVSDAEYDALERELRAVEAAHPELAAPDSPSRPSEAPSRRASRPSATASA